MAREVVVQVKCDICETKHDESERQVANVIIQTDNGSHVEVDVCDTCVYEANLSTLLSLGRSVRIPKKPKQKPATDASLHPQAGYQPEKPDEKPRTVPCPVKGCDFMGYSLQSVGTHVARMHKKGKS